MEYREKHNLAQSMQDNACIGADRALLYRIDPNNILIHRIGVNETLSFELVYALLGFVSENEIAANRKAFKPEAVNEVVNSTKKESKKAGSKKQAKASAAKKQISVNTGNNSLSEEKTDPTEKKS